MKALGIDPGLNGGLAVVDSASPQHVELLIMPTIGGKDYDIQAIKRFVVNQHLSLALVEQQIALPGQGLSSTLQTGKGFGILLGLLAGLEVPHQVIPAKLWQRKMFTGVSAKLDTKVKSEIIAKRLFPKADFRRSERAHVAADGLTDAACIAMYGIRMSITNSSDKEPLTNPHTPMSGVADICSSCGTYIPGSEENCSKAI